MRPRKKMKNLNNLLSYRYIKLNIMKNILKLLNNILNKTLLHTDTLKDSLLSDNSFVIIVLGLGLCLAFLIYKYFKK